MVFSSQWLVNVITLRPYSTVIWDFIRRYMRVFTWWMQRRWEYEEGWKCLCACLLCLRLIEWLSIKYWVLSSVWKMGRSDLNALLRNVISQYFANIRLYNSWWNLWDNHIHLLAASDIFITTYVYATVMLHCLLAAAHHQLPHWLVCHTTHGWKMLWCLAFA